ncbi:MAG: 2-oxo acid dehydrogenase subunit E2 [Planctomycetes bacterium]|nr:2-oxo acid dehydrogenase subunit E2 [Planctomycetota bacterium]
MSIEFKLPELAEGIESADIAEILVAEGDSIEAGQVVMEVETEKAVADIECPHGGRIEKVHVSEGDSVEVGSLLLTIAEGDEAADEAAAEDQDQPEADEEEPPAPKPKKERAEQDEREPAPEVTSDAPEPPEPSLEATEETPEDREAPHTGRYETGPDDPQVAPKSSTELARLKEDGREHPPAPAAPSTRRMARQLGVDLHKIKGSGPGGRITTEDIQAFVRGLTTETPADIVSPMAASELPDFSAQGPVVRERMGKLARTAAANLSLSWRSIPHVTQHDLADITELEQARRRYMETAGRGGPKITMTAILVKAAVAALKEFPHVNASLDAGAGEIVLKGYYNIGIAVDTDAGLVVPVIRDCDQKSVRTIAAEMNDLAARARIRKLNVSEMQGGTFTITNLGGIGGTSFTPIVNFPEVAILGVSRTRSELRLVNGEIEERLMLPLSFSYDHRVINGADAARFIVKLSQSLSDFVQLLIEA